MKIINIRSFTIKAISACIIASSLGACATGQTEYYAAETARHEAEGKRWEAMASIAKEGDSTTKTVAMVTMALGNQGSHQATAAPRNSMDYLMQGLSIFVPVLGQAYAINQSTRLGIAQSENNTALGVSTNNAFVGMAGKIQAAPAPQANIITTNNIGGDGNVGSGSLSKTDTHNTINTNDNHASDSHNVNPSASVTP